MKENCRIKYVINKCLRYGITLLIILSINFVIPRMMPGDPIIYMLGEDARHVDEQTLQQLRAEYGLDKPLYVQYFNYMMSIKNMNFGYSIHKNLNVKDLIADRLFWTFVLVFPAVTIDALLALLMGSVAGFMKGSTIDGLLLAGNLLLYTCPSFLVAMLTVTIFSFHLGWFPLGNMASGQTEGVAYIFDVCWHLFLPIAVLSLVGASYKFLVIRNSIVQINDEYFIFVARAKGLSERMIAFRHVLRNILPQFISMIALNFGFMVSGAIIIEIVFSLNGMGTLIYDAVLARDYPVMQGTFVVLTIFVLAANFFADIFYGLADPRIGDM